MVKELNGRELVGFIKERQAHQVKALRSRKIRPKLVIIRDSNNPVIEKYVSLKKAYGEDIEIEVIDQVVNPTKESICHRICQSRQFCLFGDFAASFTKSGVDRGTRYINCSRKRRRWFDW